MFAEVVEDIVGSVNWLMKDPLKFVGRQDSYDKNINASTHVTMPMDTDVLNNVESQRKSEVSKLVRTLLAGAGQQALACLIVSSLRDSYEANRDGTPIAEDVEELIAETDMETFAALAAAAISSNAKAVFQGFPKGLLGKFQGKVESLLEKTEKALDLQNSSKESLNSLSQEDSPIEKPATSPVSPQ